MGIQEAWAKSTTSRMKPGGDLYTRPKTRAEMTAPLRWWETQNGVSYRYGELADGTIGYEKVWVHPEFRDKHPGFVQGMDHASTRVDAS